MDWKNINHFREIKNLDRLNLDKKSFVFHAGTKIIKDRLVSNGGRVLNITSTGNNFYKIRKKIAEKFMEKCLMIMGLQ